ncbi:MAG: FHA domain-containing protein [Myxococcales bacterium]|nr:FHA domain-containing protein [Myxococcales bacterium]
MANTAVGFLTIAATLGIAAVCPSQAGAQSTKLHMERLGFDSLPDLKVYLTFVEGDGTVIQGRNASDFKLLLDSAEQGPATKVITFDAAKEPIFIMAVVQLSPAMESVLDKVKEGVRLIADSIAGLPGSKMGLLGYASDVKRLVESGTPSEIGSAVGQMAIDPEGAEVRMLDAVRTAIDLLKAQEKGRRRLIVLFSDGIDVNNEKKAFVDIGRRAEKEGIVIDTIGYAPFEPGKLKSLLELSKNSYGTERGCKAPSEIVPRFSAVVDEILKQYVVTFPLAIQGDDKEHTFQVLNEAGARPVYSQTVNRILPSAPTGPRPVEGPKQARSRWWLWLLPIPVVALVVYLLLRKKPQDVVAQPQAPQAVEAPMPTAGGANRTLAIEASGDVVMGWLTGLTGPHKNVDYKLKARTVLGTAPDCDIVIQDPRVSAHHCEIRQAEGGFKMVDLGSTNGLIVNDKRVKEHFLVDNDVFRVGTTEFKFKSIIS